MTPAELLTEARRLGMLPLFYDPDRVRAQATVEALAAGGATLVEYTLRGPGAERILADLIEACPPGVAVGAGSVPDLARLEQALDAGAAFVVGPNGERELADRCLDAGVAYVPGCLSPSEVVRAQAWGCELVKVFPVAAVGGPAYVRALRGPLPNAQLVATGGVGIDDAAEYLRAGAACVGLGSELVRRAWVEEDDGRPLAEATAALLAQLHGVRSKAG